PNLPEVHTFCMCPGGMIVPAVDKDGEMVTNGMSFSLRNMKYANSGLVSTFFPEDFGGDRDPLAGVRFQQTYERMAYKAGGGGFVCPAQPASDFLSNLVMKRDLEGSYPRGRRYVEMASILPERFSKALAYALRDWDKRLPGFAGSEAILHAVESRGSCPVRIPRNPETRQSLSMAGLYPAGEGAGYAGGIVSAALDGIHSAKALIEAFAPRSN
ncbi:MAG: FAD-dependent oxidoreductase, partial [Planctomycetes bacterium]|nr:FAD-dependent oxidoreductase [Planctomycetota bacterium]